LFAYLNRMPKLPDILPTDVSSIRKIGVKNYQEKLFWPVSDHEFLSTIEFLLDAFDDLYMNLDPDGRDVVLSDVAFVDFIVGHLHAIAVSNYCRARDININAGPKWESDLKPDWKRLCSEFDKSIRDRRYVYRLRRIAKNIAFNSHLNLRSQIKGHFSSDGLSLGSASRLRQEYLFQNSLFIDNHYWPTLLDKCNFEKRKIGLSVSAKKRIENFTEVVSSYCSEKLQAPFDARSFMKCWVGRLTTLNTIYKFLLEHGPSTKYFLFTETGQILNKLVAHALNRKGAKTVAFHHGNHMGGTGERAMVYNGPSSCSEFVCPTSECADSIRSMYKQMKISKYKKPKFTSTETKYYCKVWEESQAFSFPERIETVMIMGYPMTPIRYFDYPGLYFYFQLDLELRLVSLLKLHGFKVLYKIHPEVTNEVKDIFMPLCDKILFAPFENVWHEADALIAKYSASTTFGFALCTNRPIFFIDLEKLDYWHPEHYEKLRKRCHMIDAWTNEQNRIEFDEDKLLEGLSSKQEYPDFSYIKKYMFPLET
ncbi:MAG: hypothetical protein DRP08_02280, partial [Candidatus Aenigmatarchaeota archaeon]